MEEGDEPGDAALDDDLDDGVGLLQARLGPGVGVVVHLDRDDPAVEQGLVFHRQAVERRGGARRGESWSVVVVVVGAVVVVVVAAVVVVVVVVAAVVVARRWWWSRPVPSRRRRGGRGPGRRAGRGGRVSWRGTLAGWRGLPLFPPAGAGARSGEGGCSAPPNGCPLASGGRRARLPRRRGGGDGYLTGVSTRVWRVARATAVGRPGDGEGVALAPEGHLVGVVAASRGCPTARRGARNGSVPTRPRRWPSAGRPRRSGWRWGRRGPPGPGSPCWRRRPTDRARG